MYLNCVWKWIWSQEQNSAPESRRVSLHSVKDIKMSRPTTDRFLILWSLHGSLCCYETGRETDCTAFLSLTGNKLREDNSDAPETLAFLTAPIRSRAHVWNCLSASDGTDLIRGASGPRTRREAQSRKALWNLEGCSTNKTETGGVFGQANVALTHWVREGSILILNRVMVKSRCTTWFAV